MHQTYPCDGIDQTTDIMNTCFATTAYASRVAIHCTINMSPGVLVFEWDMMLNIPLMTDFLQFHQQWQIIIDEQWLQYANLCHWILDYVINLVMRFKYWQTTLPHYKTMPIDPFTDTPVQTNATITLRCTLYIVDCFNYLPSQSLLLVQTLLTVEKSVNSYNP